MASTNEIREVSSDFGAWIEAGGMRGVAHLEGEENWASLKCGGGPHVGTIASREALEPTDVMWQRRIREVPYTGTEPPTTISIRRTRDPLSQGV